MRNAILSFLSAARAKAAFASVLAITLLCGMKSVDASAGMNVDAVVLSFTNSGSSAEGESELVLLVDIDSSPIKDHVCELKTDAVISVRDFRSAVGGLTALPAVLRPIHNVLDTLDAAVTGAGNSGLDFLFYASRDTSAKFSTAYRAMLRIVTAIGLSRIQDEAMVARSTLVGGVSTYNPYREGKEEGGAETASGELYDPAGWTAAIQVGLRGRLGGVRYGKLYQPRFALVASGEKRLIVKINDVGPLRPGRVLDLSERSMRYFDPFLARGLLDDAKVTLLPGEDWTPGPVGEVYLIDFAAAEGREPARSSRLDAAAELEALRARFHRPSRQGSREELRADAN